MAIYCDYIWCISLQMAYSLRQIRNSATKKKAEKLFERLEKEQRNNSGTTRSRSPSPPDSMYDALSESGMFSNVSSTLRSNTDHNHRSDPDPDILSTPKKKG